jgi:hypothetical protein
MAVVKGRAVPKWLRRAGPKWLLLCLAVFLITACLTYEEGSYLINGCDTEAEITKVGVNPGRRGSATLTVEYRFTEPNGLVRRGEQGMPGEWETPPSNKVPIRYTPGDDGSSRFVGRARWWAVLLCVISLGGLLAVAARLLIEGAQDPPPPPPPPPSSKKRKRRRSFWSRWRRR